MSVYVCMLENDLHKTQVKQHQQKLTKTVMKYKKITPIQTLSVY